MTHESESALVGAYRALLRAQVRVVDTLMAHLGTDRATTRSGGGGFTFRWHSVAGRHFHRDDHLVLASSRRGVVSRWLVDPVTGSVRQDGPFVGPLPLPEGE